MPLSNAALADKLNNVADGWQAFVVQLRQLVTTLPTGGPSSNGMVLISDGVISELLPSYKLLAQSMQKGDTGLRGAGILAVHGVPGTGVGNNGDVAVDLDTGDFYGPKASGVWGSPVLATGMQTLLTAAVAAKTAAQAAQTAAAGSAAAAATSQDTASTASTASAAAKTAAETARDASVTAKNAAEAAASSATGSASSASTSASTATTKAGEASSSASAAVTAKNQAEAARDAAVAIAGGDFVPNSARGAASGVATLDATGKLTPSQKAAYSKGDVGLGNVDNTTDAEKPVSTATATALAAKQAAATALAQGKQAIWIPASAMRARITNGAALGTVELVTNKVVVDTLDFDASTIEYAQFSIRMPKSWDRGNLTFTPVWSHAATTTDFRVSWGLQAVAVSDNEAMDVAFSGTIFSDDTGGVTDRLYDAPESAPVTVSGTPAVGDTTFFQVLRKADDATNDTLAIDARLHGYAVFFTTAASNDA